MTTLSLLHMFTTLMNDPWVRGTLFVPVLLVVLDLITGVGSAIKRQAFSWKALPQFIDTNLLRYLFGLFVMAGVNLVSGQEMAGMVGGFLGMAPLAASLLASIRENITELLPPKLATLANQAIDQFPSPLADTGSFLLDQAPVKPTIAVPPQLPPSPLSPQPARVQQLGGQAFITTSFGGGGPLAATPTMTTPAIYQNSPFSTPGQ